MKFTEHEYAVISNALRVAAKRFEDNSKCEIFDIRLKQQFKKQCDEANAIYERIANEEGVQS